MYERGEIMNNGYIIIIYGKCFEKQMLFSQSEPDEKDLEEWIHKYNGERAFVIQGMALERSPSVTTAN